MEVLCKISMKNNKHVKFLRQQFDNCSPSTLHMLVNICNIRAGLPRLCHCTCESCNFMICMSLKEQMQRGHAFRMFSPPRGGGKMMLRVCRSLLVRVINRARLVTTTQQDFQNFTPWSLESPTASERKVCQTNRLNTPASQPFNHHYFAVDECSMRLH